MKKLQEKLRSLEKEILQLRDERNTYGNQLYTEYKNKSKARRKLILGIIGFSLSVIVCLSATPIIATLIGLTGPTLILTSMTAGILFAANRVGFALLDLFKVKENLSESDGVSASKREYREYMDEVNAKISNLEKEYSELCKLGMPYENATKAYSPIKIEQANDMATTEKITIKDKNSGRQNEDGRDL